MKSKAKVIGSSGVNVANIEPLIIVMKNDLPLMKILFMIVL